MGDERALDDILERAADGSWSRCEKAFDEFSEVTVEDDIIVGFNLLVRAPAAHRPATLQPGRVRVRVGLEP